MKRLSVMLLVAALFLGACAPIASAAGYVPKSDLDAANAKIQDLTTQLTTQKGLTQTQTALADQAQADKKDLSSKLDAANANLSQKQSALDTAQKNSAQWNSLQCPNRTWDEAWNKISLIFPLTAYSDVPKEFVGYIGVTQWSTDPNWKLDTSQPYSVLMIDRDNKNSMIVDTVNDCVILNPAVFPFSGQ